MKKKKFQDWKFNMFMKSKGMKTKQCTVQGGKHMCQALRIKSK